MHLRIAKVGAPKAAAITMAAAVVLAPVAAAAGEEDRQVTAGCAICHVDVVDKLAESKHPGAGIGCVTCHGPSQGHVTDENNQVKPDVIYGRDEIDAHCVACHACSRAQPEEPPVRVCTECHGKHAEFPVKASPVLTLRDPATVAVRSGQFQGQTFRLSLPEVLWEEASGVLWSRRSVSRGAWRPGPGPGSLVYDQEVEASVRLVGTAAPLPGKDIVALRLEVTNLSRQQWPAALAVVRLDLSDVPDVADPEMIRTFIYVDDEYVPVARTDRSWGRAQANAYILKRHSPPAGRGQLPYLWTTRRERPDVGTICVRSRDGTRVPSMDWGDTHSVAQTAMPPVLSLYVNPFLGDIAPGETATTEGMLYLRTPALEEWLPSLATG
ncbi:MAG: hypothetical protein ACE5R4_03140 [Armatimonadota bacterium]